MIRIGLEVHATLPTKSKLLCSCSAQEPEEPNSHVCPTCLGHPGARICLNSAAVIQALAVAKALGCHHPEELRFSRKSYFYPDLPRNFQITQHDHPLGRDGKLLLRSKSTVHISRVHLEEDPGSILYPEAMEGSAYSLIDYNRAGRPLVEIVTTPELESPAQAREFLSELSSVLRYLGSEEQLKADLNVSVEETGYVRVEIKNVSGFREAEKALRFEVTRQKTLSRLGREVVRETRGWDGERTFPLRTKEEEADYGYIDEPNIPLMALPEELHEQAVAAIPELRHQRIARFQEMGVEPTDAEVITDDPALADLFDAVCDVDAALAARWIRREVLRVLHYHGVPLKETSLAPEPLRELLALLSEGAVTEETAQRLTERLAEEPIRPREVVEQEGLSIIRDEEDISRTCAAVIAEHPQAVADYRGGEEKSLHFLVGQVMRKTRGRANPPAVAAALAELLAQDS